MSLEQLVKDSFPCEAVCLVSEGCQDSTPGRGERGALTDSIVDAGALPSSLSRPPFAFGVALRESPKISRRSSLDNPPTNRAKASRDGEEPSAFRTRNRQSQPRVEKV